MASPTTNSSTNNRRSPTGGTPFGSASEPSLHYRSTSSDKPKATKGQRQAKTTGFLEKEDELRTFLKVARPEWLIPRRKGHSDVNRVMMKLRTIGITDVDALLDSIDKNTINEEFRKYGCVSFSKEAIDAIRERKPFMQSLKDVAVPQIRQIGNFAPLPQMLTHRVLARSSSPKELARRRNNLLKPSGPLGASGSAMTTSGTIDLRNARGSTESPRSKLGFEDSETAPRLRGVQAPLRRRDKRKLQLEGFAPRPATSPDMVAASPPASPGGHSSSMDAARSTSPSSFANARRTSGGNHVDPLSQSMGMTTESSLHLPSCLLPDEDTLLQGVHSIYGVGVSMAEDRKDRAYGSWTTQKTMTPLQLGQNMLLEQEELEAQQRLIRTVSRGGNDEAAFREYVAGKIEKRLNTEALREGGRGPTLAVHQQCMNIKKQLDGLAKARGELRGLRSRVQSIVEGQEENQTPVDFGLTFNASMFSRSDHPFAAESPPPHTRSRSGSSASQPQLFTSTSGKLVKVLDLPEVAARHQHH
mmetsp:Transcript_54579/g.119439  ORF Transcript_54579/g.119439 Transcript_54579/m.119439 type:complete len:529 (+) Transcript_54579:169-1755(+)